MITCNGALSGRPPTQARRAGARPARQGRADSTGDRFTDIDLLHVAGLTHTPIPSGTAAIFYLS
jgi:hypothetical protein